VERAGPSLRPRILRKTSMSSAIGLRGLSAAAGSAWARSATAASTGGTAAGRACAGAINSPANTSDEPIMVFLLVQGDERRFGTERRDRVRLRRSAGLGTVGSRRLPHAARQTQL